MTRDLTCLDCGDALIYRGGRPPKRCSSCASVDQRDRGDYWTQYRAAHLEARRAYDTAYTAAHKSEQAARDKRRYEALRAADAAVLGQLSAGRSERVRALRVARLAVVSTWDRPIVQVEPPAPKPPRVKDAPTKERPYKFRFGRAMSHGRVDA